MDFLINYYVSFLLDNNIPYAAGFFLWHAISFVIVILTVIVSVLIFIVAEKKLYSVLKINKTNGKNGLGVCLQTIADTIKLFFKEDIVPEKADKFLFGLAPILVLTPVLFAWMLLPFATSFLPIKTDSGVVLFLAVMTIPAIGILSAGYASKNKLAVISALHTCVQIMSYEIPLILTAMSIVVLSGSMSFRDIVANQYTNGILSWFCFPAILGVVIFFAAAVSEMCRTPFSEQKEASDYKTEYSGIKHAIFTLGEYASTFIICAFAVILFFGGYMPPVQIFLADLFEHNHLLYGVVLTFEQAFWLIFKTIILMLAVSFVKTAMPNLKNELFAKICRQYLIPISIINLLVVCLIKHGGFYVF